MFYIVLILHYTGHFLLFTISILKLMIHEMSWNTINIVAALVNVFT